MACNSGKNIPIISVTPFDSFFSILEIKKTLIFCLVWFIKCHSKFKIEIICMKCHNLGNILYPFLGKQKKSGTK